MVITIAENIKMLFAVYVSFIGTQRLLEIGGFIQFRLPVIVERILFIVPVNYDKVTLCAVVWQCVTNLTILMFILHLAGVEPFSKLRFLSDITAIFVLEWVLILLPLALYSCLAEAIKKRNS